MNAGTDYTKAKQQAQANADRSGEAWAVVGYNGSWWVNRLSSYGTVPTDADIIHPVCPNCGQFIRSGDCLNECRKRGLSA